MSPGLPGTGRECCAWRAHESDMVLENRSSSDVLVAVIAMRVYVADSENDQASVPTQSIHDITSTGPICGLSN